ncbi:MAG TPA: hypothetical protein VHE35_34040 [Kofleriaceae bacterium]|nr:hypothetical protein [Kofleriaceae bacterium]
MDEWYPLFDVQRPAGAAVERWLHHAHVEVVTTIPQPGTREASQGWQQGTALRTSWW